MKSNTKTMLLGIVCILLGIYFRVLVIGYLYSFFWELLWTALPIIGVIIFLYGFFGPEKHETLG